MIDIQNFFDYLLKDAWVLNNLVVIKQLLLTKIETTRSELEFLTFG